MASVTKDDQIQTLEFKVKPIDQMAREAAAIMAAIPAAGIEPYGAKRRPKRKRKDANRKRMAKASRRRNRR